MKGQKTDDLAIGRDGPKTSLSDFSRLLGKNRGEYVGVTAVAALLGGVEGFVHPLLIKAIFDEAALHGEFNRFIYLVLSYLALGLTLNVGAYVTSLWQKRMDNKIVQRVSSDLLKSFYSEEYGRFLRNGSGYYVSRIRADVKDGLEPMLALVRTIVVKISMFIALLSALIFISWQAFVILSALIPIATCVSVVVSRRIRSLTVSERDKEAQVMSLLTKAVGGLKLACTFGLTSKTVDVFDRGMEKVLDSGYRRFRMVRTLQGTSDLTMVISDVCSIFIGALFVFQRKMTIGSFIAFMNAFWRASTTLIAIFKHWAEMQSCGTTVSRICEFLRLNSNTSSVSRSRGISAKGISYAYDGQEIFSGFTMMIEPGGSALITGDNGSGKTTLANILAGHLEPTKGHVSISENVSAITLPLAFPPLKVNEIGADQSLLSRFGMDTSEILEAYPDQLSAGQQQKLALALALGKSADVYILDEPLANLDSRSRAIAMAAIIELTKGRTLAMIMHGSDEFQSFFSQVLHLDKETSNKDVLQEVESA